MLTWNRILCAVDFSEASREAKDVAADVARRCEGELTLVHVAMPPVPTAGDLLVSEADLSRTSAEQARFALEGWRESAEARAERPVKAIVLVGSPAQEVVRQARDEQADLLVVSTHGRTGLARLVLGSVAEQILRHAPCPVLAVKPRERT
jgi:nucleotide-binding universal stress UspA family protein